METMRFGFSELVCALKFEILKINIKPTNIMAIFNFAVAKKLFKKNSNSYNPKLVRIPINAPIPGPSKPHTS